MQCVYPNIISHGSAAVMIYDLCLFNSHLSRSNKLVMLKLEPSWLPYEVILKLKLEWGGGTVGRLQPPAASNWTSKWRWWNKKAVSQSGSRPSTLYTLCLQVGHDVSGNIYLMNAAFGEQSSSENVYDLCKLFCYLERRVCCFVSKIAAGGTYRERWLCCFLGFILS